MADVAETGRRHDAAFDSKDDEARKEVEAPDIEVILPGGVVLHGSEEALGFLKVFWEALPDAKLTHENEVTAGDTVVFEGAMTGTHTGTFRSPQGDIPASGNRVNARYVSVKKIRDGKVVSDHVYFDQMEVLQQIGAMPAP